MNSCSIIPQIRNKEGELVDSKLFTDLLSITNNNRDEAKRIYTLTKSDNFKEWFKNSKIVDDNNEPLLVYHASEAKFEEFKKDKISDAEKWGNNEGIINKLKFLFQKPSSFGFFFTKDLSYIDTKSKNLYPVFLNIENPLIAEANEESKFWSSNKTGDGAIWDNMLEIVAYESNQIKSIYNNGEFDSLSNNIFKKEQFDQTINPQSDFYTREEAFNDLKPLKTNSELLKYVLNKTDDPVLKEITQKLLDNIKKINLVNFKFTSIEGGALGLYSNDTGELQLNVAEILLDPKRIFLETVVHEYIHAFTMSALNNPKTEAELEFSKYTKKAYDSFKDKKINNKYGLTNQYEFVAELLSNKDFTNDLRKIQPTIVEKIINYVKNLLGINTNTNIDELITNTASFIDVSTPKITPGAVYKRLEKRREGVVSEINTYASERIDANGNIKQKERFLLQVHKKVKFQIGKLNNKISNINKDIKVLELQHRKDVRQIIDDYTAYNNGVYDTGYKNSPLFKNAELAFNTENNILLNQITNLETNKFELANLLADLDTTTDINVHEANYINLALKELDAIATRINQYDLNSKEGQNQLAEDYLFTRLVNKTPDIIGLQETASNLSTQLLQNISSYISTISDTYLNTSGLGQNINIDVESILETNDDIITLGKVFEGFGDYPRLEAQLIHNITMNGKEKARLKSLKVGQTILNHIKELQNWSKNNKNTNIIGQGSIRKAYAQLVEVNNLNRLDLVKPFTIKYYNDINKYFKQAYNKNDPNYTDAKSLIAKNWLKDNYYTKPTTGTYINEKYTYLQSQPELKGFYDYFKQTIKDNYSKLPEYINLKNEEKIPTMIKNSFWEFFSMRKDNIFKSSLLALKTILIGQGRAEFYDENGNSRQKFELAEFSQDEMKLRMIGEVDSDIKSFDLGHILFEFTSFVNDYSEMAEVLPKVRMIQNIVETKEYISTKKNGLFGLKKETIAGGQSRMYDAINLYINGKIKGVEENPKLRLGGGDIYDNNGDVIGRKSYYLSDMVRSLIRYTRTLQLGFNPFSGINNILAGLMGDMVEASGGKFFSKRQLLQAISIYTSNGLAKGKELFTGDENTTKLNLLSEYLQPLEEIGEWQDKRKLSLGPTTLVGKGIESITSKAFIFQEAGEDFVQKITMIAYLLNKKTPEGSSYWSMIEVENGKLKYKQENNFDTEAEILKSRNTILDINHNIHGNYSKDNSSVYDGALLFDSALVFKKWLPYMIRNRFMSKRYNYKTGKNDEGFYLAGARAIGKSINNIGSYFENKIKQNKNLILTKKTLTPEDIIGIKKVITEMTMFLVFATLSKIVMPPPDDKKDKAWVPNFWEHLDISMWDSEKEFDNKEGIQSIFIKSMIDSSNRMTSEAIQMFDPSFYYNSAMRWALWSTLNEGWDVIRESFKFLTADNKDSKDLRYRKGPNKGNLRVTKEITDIIPYYKQIDRAKRNGSKTIEDLNK